MAQIFPFSCPDQDRYQHFHPPYHPLQSLPETLPISLSPQQKHHRLYQPLSEKTLMRDVADLWNATHGLGTDEWVLVSVFSRRGPPQLLQIMHEFERQHYQTLRQKIGRETSFQFGKLCDDILMCKPWEFEVNCIKQSITLLKTDKTCILQVLLGKSNVDLDAIQNVYASTFDKNLIAHLKKHLKPPIETFFVLLLQGRAQKSSVQECIARILEEKDKTKVLIEILASSPEFLLRELFQQFQTNQGDSFEEFLKNEKIDNDLQKALLSTVEAISNYPKYIARCLYESMKGLGTDDAALRRLIVMNRSPMIMPRIKEEFLQAYGKTLESFIQDDTSGDYMRLLMAMVELN